MPDKIGAWEGCSEIFSTPDRSSIQPYHVDSPHGESYEARLTKRKIKILQSDFKRTSMGLCQWVCIKCKYNSFEVLLDGSAPTKIQNFKADKPQVRLESQIALIIHVPVLFLISHCFNIYKIAQ